MGLKTEHRAFFAIPFDVATRALYESVSAQLRGAHPGLITVIGAEEIGPSPEYSTIMGFKAQNRELFERFVGQIRASDIIVADLTNNNPNVHVELGIGLMLNKNILRVTGRSLTELGFDVRGLEVYQYADGERLRGRIDDYIRMFERIKDLPLDGRAGGLFHRRSTPRVYDAAVERGWYYECVDQLMRDGAVRARFVFTTQRSDEDWFGVYLRTSAVHPWFSSCLVYVRRNGMVEVATYPGTVVRAKEQLFGGRIESEARVLVEIEGDSVRATVGDGYVRLDGLENQDPRLVCLGAWQSRVECREVEIVRRDTIEFGDSSRGR